MLLLISKDVNVCEITKVLVKYKIRARILNKNIYLDGTLPDELLDTLAEKITVLGVQNYSDEINCEPYAQSTIPTPMIVKTHNHIIEDSNEVIKVEETVLTSEENNDTISVEPHVSLEPLKEKVTIPNKAPKRTYKRHTVKRGQVYRCDLGPLFGSEQGGVRPVIIIQNDVGNKYSPTTIVIPFTTHDKQKYLPTHFRFKFSKENMVDYTKRHPGLSSKYNTALTEQIQTIDKSRLICYLGTMTDSFMEELYHFISTSLYLPKECKLELSQHFNVISEITEVPSNPAPVQKSMPIVPPLPDIKPASAPTPNCKKKKTTFRNDSDYDYLEKQIGGFKPAEPPKHIPIIKSVEELNDVQKGLLTFANTTDIYNICSKTMSDDEKVKKLLEIFGFSSSIRGINLLNQAILASLSCSYYNLETLSTLVAKNEPSIDAKEVQRLIVARVKEHFKFKKAPTSDFIRLINNLIKTKGELVNE